MLFKFPPKMGSRDAMIKYLEADLWSWLRDLSIGLLKLNFSQNFESFRVNNLLIKNGEQVVIANQLKPNANNAIPSSWLIVRQGPTGASGNLGGGLLTEGITPWSTDFLYLYNHGPEDTLVSVIFFK